MYITIYRIKTHWLADDDNFRTIADIRTDNQHKNVQLATMNDQGELTISVNARMISTTRDKEGKEHLVIVVNDSQELPHFINLKMGDFDYMTGFE